MRRRIVNSVLWSAAILILASGCTSSPTAPTPAPEAPSTNLAHLATG